MKIPVQPIHGAAPQMCLSNVRKRIKALGGPVAFGWKIKDIGHGWTANENHAVCRSPQGQLFCVTLVYEKVEGNSAICSWPDEIEFQEDEGAAFEDKNQPGHYIPPNDNPHLRRAAEFMRRGDVAMNAGELESCRYWTNKADEECRKGKSSIYFDVPKSCDLSDIVATMVNEPGGTNSR